MRVFVTQTDMPPPIPAGAAGGIVALPGGQAAATQLAARVNIVTNVASGTGVLLQNILGGQMQVLNRGAFPLSVYPPAGTQIEGQSVNAAATIAVGGSATFTYDNVDTWYVS